MNVFLRRCTKFVAILCFSSIAPLLFHTGAAAAAGETEILSYKPIEQGAPFVAITYLPYTATALSASVTGPFLIAMQTNYTYGTIDGIHFGNTASTNGQCNVSSEDECGSYLLIEQLPSTAVGLDIGTVTLSNGTSFQIQTNVQTPSLIVDPPSLYSFTLAGGTGDPLRLSLTNASASAVSIGAPSFIDELNHGAASYFAFAGGCGNSLAPGATCVVDVSFSPTTSNEVSGYIQVPTGLGSVDVAFESDGGQPPADLQINPQNIDFPVGADGASPIRTITIKNASQVAESIDIPASSVNIVSNDCATIPAQGSCEIELQLTVDPHEPFTSGVLEPFVFFVSPYTGPGAGAFTIGIAAYASPGPPSPAVIATSPSTLQFPATPFGQPSAPMNVTVTNVSTRTLTIAIPSVIDFVADPTCAQLLPGASCDVPVRFLPLSGNPAATGSLIFTATDAADPTGLTVAQSQQTIATTGSSIPQASLASPFGVIVAAFDDASNTSLNVTNTSNVPLVFASITGNRNYYAGEAVVVDTTGCGATLAPNKTCTLVVNAHECNEGVGPSCYLSISSNALSSPDTYAFNGNEAADIHSMLAVDSGPVVFTQTATGSKSASQIIHVTLTNDSASVSVPFTILPVTEGDFTVDNQCPQVLVPVAVSQGFAMSCEIVVTFVPQSQGFHFAALTYRSSLQGASVPLAGTGIAPSLKVDPLSLKFPVTAVKTSSAAQTVTVTNPGASAIVIKGVSLTGAQADDYALGTGCGGSLAAGANCEISVTFKPVSAGTKLASITIADNAGDSRQSVSLSGIGTSSAAPLSIQCPTSTARFGAAYDSSPVATGGVPPYVFSIAQGALPDGLALNVNTGAITGTPTAAAKYAFEIQVTDASQNVSDKASQACSITVTPPTSPALAATPSSLSFGTVEHYSSQIKEVTFRNTSTVPITLWHAIVTPSAGTGAHDFSAIDRCDTTLAPGAACTIYIVFVSEQTGSLSARLSVPNSARQPVAIGLSASVTNGASASSSNQ